MYPFVLAGILLLPRRPLPAAAGGRILLDGLMTMTALVAFSWYFLLGPTILQGGENALSRFLSAAYPLGDLVLLFCLLMVLFRGDASEARGVSIALSLGIVSVIVADVVFGYLTLKETYKTGVVSDVGWALGTMLVCWAAYAIRVAAGAEPAGAQPAPGLGSAARRAPVLWRSLLPYAMVPAVAALFLFTVNTEGAAPLKAGVYVSSAALVGLLLMRQVMALCENRHVYRLLNDAYGELEAKSRKTQEYAQSQERLNEELQAVRDELEAQNGSLADANAKLEALATTDGMTGLANHRAFQGRLRTELARAERHEKPLSLLLLDVDHFKRYNDTYGHPAGDDVLCTVGRLMRGAVRETDLAARYGGEEFAVLLPDTDAETALLVAERIRAAVAAYPFPHADVTVSIGATHGGIAGGTPEALVASADGALYAAKRSGRNRVLLAGEELGVVGSAPALPRAA
jgi:diguanylate cyclase (GGDEF)-like protein